MGNEYTITQMRPKFHDGVIIPVKEDRIISLHKEYKKYKVNGNSLEINIAGIRIEEMSGQYGYPCCCCPKYEDKRIFITINNSVYETEFEKLPKILKKLAKYCAEEILFYVDDDYGNIYKFEIKSGKLKHKHLGKYESLLDYVKKHEKKDIVCKLATDEAVFLIGQGDSYQRSGKEILAKKEYEEALKMIELALKANPKDAEALYQKARAFYELKRKKECLQICKKLLKPEENSIKSRYYYLAGLCELYIAKDYENAIEYFLGAMDQTNKEKDGQKQRDKSNIEMIECHLKEKETEIAINECHKLLNSTMSKYIAGMAVYRIARACALDKNYEEMITNLKIAALLNKEYIEMARNDRYFKKYWDDIAFVNFVGNVSTLDETFRLIEQKKYKKALKMMEKKMNEFYLERVDIQDAQKQRMINNYFYLCFRLGEYKRAKRWIDKEMIQETGKENPSLYHNTACIYVALGKQDNALDQIKKAKKYGYDKMNRIAVDQDLKPLFNNPKFKAIVAGIKKERGTCPCCGYKTLSEKPPGTYEICEICFWKEDEIQFNDPDYEEGANNVSLRQAQMNFKKYGVADPQQKRFARKPTRLDEKDPKWKMLGTEKK